ncbi:MAG: SPFH domain-containing protein, partial [Verrucomicrobiota bacterium]
GSNQMAVLKSFGKVSENPLQPGLHFKMPWPFGEVNRYPVKTVNALQVGFVDPEFSKRKALLWSKAHGQEFNLVLGNAVDLVTINMILYYKIHEDAERFFDYALQNQNPVEALETYAYRALMEYTQTSTLKEVLAVNRAKFATNLERAIRDYAERNRLGIQLIDVALINIHPPVEVSPAYLDVISAEIDAKRSVVEAEGYSEMRLHQTEQESYTVESQARIQRARRIGLANKEAMEFRPLSEARSIAPDAYRMRLWFETWENALTDKRLLLIDKSLANDSGNFFLDLRPISDNALRNLDPLKSGNLPKP